MKSSGNTDARTLVVNWWDLIPPEILKEVYRGDFPGWEIEHAGIAETSMMMTLKPELVRIEQIRDSDLTRRLAYDIIPPLPDIIPESGVPSKPSTASRNKGEALVLVAVDKLVEAIHKDLVG